MYAKAACIIAQTVANYLSIAAPQSSAHVKTDKIKKNSFLLESYIYIVGTWGLWIIPSLSALYLIQMYQGVISPHLKTWQLATTIISVLATLLRRWAFKTLDRFFTYHMTLREGHRLIKTGPYRYVLHPSYTGLFLNLATYTATVGYEGLCDPIPISLILLAVVWIQSAVFLDRGKDEEAMLAEAFGQEWVDYATTRWRFVPLVY
ncbi:hypothetical protein EC991_005050 [Linnemannia zychae]|nr:hypothetical protein EC991_005050 [Linnemannia zychae]